MSNNALQIELNSAITIDANTNVLFDTITYSSGNISYDPVTGVVTFREAGRYVINWWLATYTTQIVNGTSFALISSQGDYIEGSILDRSDKVDGVGIVDVTTAPVTLSLVNVSTTTIYFSFISSLKGILVIVEDDIELIGPTGPTGDTGPAGDLLFTNTTGAIPVYPPIDEETIVASVAVPVTTDDNVKIDYALGLQVVNTANYNIITEFRLYRDGTLIDTRTLNSIGAEAGTQRIDIASTYVDTAVETRTSTYELRAIITTDTNITSASAYNRNLNIIVF